MLYSGILTRSMAQDDDSDWEANFRTEVEERQGERVAEIEKQLEEDFNRQIANIPDDEDLLERLRADHRRNLVRIRKLMKEEEDAVIERGRQVRQQSQVMGEGASNVLKRKRDASGDHVQDEPCSTYALTGENQPLDRSFFSTNAQCSLGQNQQSPRAPSKYARLDTELAARATEVAMAGSSNVSSYIPLPQGTFSSLNGSNNCLVLPEEPREEEPREETNHDNEETGMDEQITVEDLEDATRIEEQERAFRVISWKLRQEEALRYRDEVRMRGTSSSASAYLSITSSYQSASSSAPESDSSNGVDERHSSLSPEPLQASQITDSTISNSSSSQVASGHDVDLSPSSTSHASSRERTPKSDSERVDVEGGTSSTSNFSNVLIAENEVLQKSGGRELFAEQQIQGIDNPCASFDTEPGSVTPNESRSNATALYEEQLKQLLDGLRNFDLSEDIFDQTEHFNAHGGSSDVFKAKSRRHGDMTVAIKRLRFHIYKNKDVSKIIFRELRVWSTLNHPNVLSLLGYIMHGRYPALVSKWMVNGSVLDYLR